MSLRHLIFVIVLGLCSKLLAKKSLNMDHVNMMDWELPGDGEYSEYYELSSHDFNKRVLQSQDAWVVVICKEEISKSWKRLARQLKASVWFGFIDYEKQRRLAEKLVQNLENEDLEACVALVYPFARSKKENLDGSNQWPWKVKNPAQAEKVLTIAIPRSVKALTFSRKDRSVFQDWILEAYYKSDIPRFPVICLTDEESLRVPISLLALSNHLSSHFSFGVVWKSGMAELLKLTRKLPQPKAYPQYLILIGKEPTAEEMKRGKFGLTFDIVPFIPEKYGEANKFLAVVKFLFTINEDYRIKLLGRKANETEEIQNMEPIRETLRNRLDQVSKSYDYILKTEL